MKRCPNCGNTTFEVDTHIIQSILVDEEGYYISTLEECIETIHSPDDDDIWVCSKCGYDAAGSEFNVKE